MSNHFHCNWNVISNGDTLGKMLLDSFSKNIKTSIFGKESTDLFQFLNIPLGIINS